MSSSRDKAWETLINEVFTHLTTLSSGSIVVLTALSPEFDLSGWLERGLAILAVAGFFATIGYGLAAKLAVAKLSARETEDERYRQIENWMTTWGGAALLAFGIAMVALGALAIRSFVT